MHTMWVWHLSGGTPARAAAAARVSIRQLKSSDESSPYLPMHITWRPGGSHASFGSYTAHHRTRTLFNRDRGRKREREGESLWGSADGPL